MQQEAGEEEYYDEEEGAAEDYWQCQSKQYSLTIYQNLLQFQS